MRAVIGGVGRLGEVALGAWGSPMAMTTRASRSVLKTALVILLIAAGAAVAGCGEGHGARAAPSRHSGAAPPSPCGGLEHWRGASLRRCTALVSRLAAVDSVALTAHPSSRVRATCEQAGRQARIPVVCPPLVPGDGVVADPNLYGAEGARQPETAGAFYLLTFNNGENVGHVHWIVGAGRGRSVQRNLFDPRVWAVPGRVRRLGERRYGPWTIAFYRFPPFPSGGQLGGHDLALAEVHGTTYFVSVHGRTHHDADAAMLIAILLSASPGR
jgi:hypothetical protein